METNDFEEFKKTFGKIADSLPFQMQEVQKRMEAFLPKSSIRVLINGMEVTASKTEGGLVVFDFADKKNAEMYFNTLQVI